MLILNRRASMIACGVCHAEKLLLSSRTALPFMRLWMSRFTLARREPKRRIFPNAQVEHVRPLHVVLARSSMLTVTLATPPDSGRPSVVAAWAVEQNIQRPEMRPGETLERRAQQDIHLGNVVGAEQLHLRQEVRIDLAPWDRSDRERER